MFSGCLLVNGPEQSIQLVLKPFCLKRNLAFCRGYAKIEWWVGDQWAGQCSPSPVPTAVCGSPPPPMGALQFTSAPMSFPSQGFPIPGSTRWIGSCFQPGHLSVCCLISLACLLEESTCLLDLQISGPTPSQALLRTTARYQALPSAFCKHSFTRQF